MLFIRIFIDNVKSRFIRRDKPWFKKRHELCYSNWYHDQYNGGEQ